MKNIEECLKENLTETDVEILNSSITDIAEKTEEKQKTLKEHHKDIVTCAEMFFLEYGEYFTEKEKNWWLRHAGFMIGERLILFFRQ